MAIIRRMFRLLGGLAVVAAVLAVAFTMLPGWMHFWGATNEEINRPMPGDEVLQKPIILWTHGITIDAVPEAVWPWIAQIGDVRGGYYSYTLIENTLAGGDIYHNADRIIPEYQRPRPGDSLIGGVLAVKEVVANRYLLGASFPQDGWTWVWALYPAEGSKTRLVVRNRIQPVSEDLPAIATLFMDLGGFVMEKRMMQGIKDRAEGRIDPPYQERLELGLWLAALASGVLAGLLFLIKRDWKRPLAVGVASILVLFTLIFAQPGIVAGLALDAALVAGLGWSVVAGRSPVPARAVPSPA